MRNIYILPTDKPSRLSNCHNNKLHLNDVRYLKNYQHIYITSDKEINQQTKPCWCINTIKNTWNEDLIYYQGAMPKYHFVGFKKIILTTDPDIIKYGIQAIPDDFLEWFVKNPSCKEVKLNKIYSDYGETDIFDLVCTSHSFEYKIIIPKEESKQRLEKYSERFDNEFETQLIDLNKRNEKLTEELIKFEETIIDNDSFKEKTIRLINEKEYGFFEPISTFKSKLISKLREELSK